MHSKGQEAPRLQCAGAQSSHVLVTDNLQDSQSTQNSTPNDIAEDSCWTDLPDLHLSNNVNLQSDVFARDASQASSPTIQSLSMFNLNEADFLLPEQFDSALFPDQSGSLADMDLESLLADPACTLPLDKQLQPKTPSASNIHFDDFLQQLYPSGPCPPTSRDIEQQRSQSQESAAEDVRMVPVGPASGPVDALDSMTAGQFAIAASVEQQTVKKHPRIIVRLNRPAIKKKSKAAQRRTAFQPADKQVQEGSHAVATTPVIPQRTHHSVTESAPRKKTSQEVGTQTDFPSESNSCNLHPEHPLISAHPAEALAEGTRLLMAAPEGTAPRRQHSTQQAAGLKAAPWTLLTQSNIQLRLKPTVTAAGTQTEDVVLSDQPSNTTVGRFALAAASCHMPQGEGESASIQAAQLAPTAALPKPSQASHTTETGLPPAVSASKKGKGTTRHQVSSSSRTANRQALRHKPNPNAHLMFQCQVGSFPSATFAPAVPTDSCQPQMADCLTPARPSDLDKRRRSSVSFLSPPTSSPLQPAADAAIDLSQAATSAADPLEIQLADAGTSSKSASKSSPPAVSASVKKPSQVQPSLQAGALSDNKNSECLHSSHQSDKATLLPNASTTKQVNVSPSASHPDKVNMKNGTADATARAAAAPKATHVPLSSKPTAAVNPALPDGTPIVSASPQTIQASGNVHPAPTAQEPAQRCGQDYTQPTSHPVSASPTQAASHQTPGLGSTLPAPKAPRAPTAPVSSLVVGAKLDQAADASPGKPTQTLSPGSPTHKAAPYSQQGKQHHTATTTKSTPNAAAPTLTSKAAIPTAPSSPSQVKTRGKSQIQSHALHQLESTCTADALRSDLISTAGCHVTRRLVQHLLEPISQPVGVARACSQPTRGTSGGASHSMAKGAQPPASKGRASGHSQGTEAGRKVSAHAVRSSQPSRANKATGTQAAPAAQVPNADHSKQANQSKQASKDKHRPAQSKAVTVKERQQSMPSTTEKATEPKAAAQKATDVKLETKHAIRATAGKTRSILELNEPQTAPAAAINLTTDRKKTGSSTAAGTQQTPAGKTANTNTADQEKAPSSSNKVTASGGSKPNGSVTKSKESQPSASSASQAQSGSKRLRSDASAAASAPAKKPKSTCATAAGLNPKFMATKTKVLRLIGDREGVLEAELRRSMGNNPDTSKALRKLHKEGALQRSGAGGRPDPFKWTKTLQS